jgi:hypothetical protein
LDRAIAFISQFTVRLFIFLEGEPKGGSSPILMRLRSFGNHMTKKSSYRESLLQSLEDPIEAIAYPNAGLEDSMEAFLKALKTLLRLIR